LPEALEERWTPDVRTWVGSVSTDMAKPGNWNGGLPSHEREAVFDTSAAREAELPANRELAVGKLTVKNNFPESITVIGPFKLVIGNVAGDSTW
jgi:hypothetical protein